MEIKIGNTLKNLRETINKTREEVSNETGITVRKLKDYELDITKPPLENLVKLADYYDVSTDLILGRERTKILKDARSLADDELDKFIYDTLLSMDLEARESFRKLIISIRNSKN